MSQKYNEDRPDDQRLPARYANYAKVGYNASEFLLDFGQYYSDKGSPLFHTRIVTGPTYVKAFLHILQASVEEYEAAYGAIQKEKQDDL